MKEIDIPVILDTDDSIPVYGSHGAAGADLKAQIEIPVLIQPNESAIVPTGVKVEIPEGYEIQVRPRSGLAAKNQITVLNTPGTIDCDYRGEIKIILINHGKTAFEVTPGMRIAQAVLAPYVKARFVKVESHTATKRGINGFGHTGTH